MVFRGKINLRNLNTKQQESMQDLGILERADLVEFRSSNNALSPNKPVRIYSPKQEPCFPNDVKYNSSSELEKMYRGQEI